MSLLQTFPITNRPPRRQRIFCSLDSCLFVFSRLRRLTIVNHCWVRLMQPWLVLSCFLPRSDVAVHRHPRSPTGDAARPPAFVPPPPRLASSHSFLRARTIAVRTAVSGCPVRRLPTCIANSPPATVVTSVTGLVGLRRAVPRRVVGVAGPVHCAAVELVQNREQVRDVVVGIIGVDAVGPGELGTAAERVIAEREVVRLEIVQTAQ